MTITQIISIVVVLLVAAVGGFFIVKKSEKHDLFKWIGLFIFVAIALTWILGYGYYQGAQFTDHGKAYIHGLTDLPNMVYNAMNLAGDKVVFLLALGAFYAVVSKYDGYKKLVVTIAEKLKGKEILFTLLTSLGITALTAVLSQTFIVLIFVPFIISIILSMKLDKMTAFAVTFGSMLVGSLGLIYGGEGLYWFSNYAQINLKVGILYRLIVLVIAYILFNFFTMLHVKKVLKGKLVSQIEEDPFKVENVDKKAKLWPIITILSVMTVLILLGYIAWEVNFGITVFSEFHTWLLGIKIGDLEIFKAILGTVSRSTPFGAWNLFQGATLLFIVSIIIAILGKVKLGDFLSTNAEGYKKIGKSVLLYVGTYMVMAVAYQSRFIPTITNALFSGIETFNPFLVTVNAFISNIFHVDLGLTGFLTGSFFTATYGANVEVIHTIFTTMHGFVTLCVPTSGILLIGLPYLNIEYKTWMKYIWMFVLAVLVILLVLFTVMTYI